MDLRFDNRFHAELPHLYSEPAATPLTEPELVIVSEQAKALLDWPEAAWHPDFLSQVFSGRLDALAGAQPLAQVYSGHQFGQYVPRLGDGRGMLLGEVVNKQGQRWDLHLKGIGRTPYSRFGDGRAVLRSTIREFLGSEALAALGIPTSRALTIVTSSEPVQRETVEPAAMMARLAPSHIRFGHFEYLFFTDQHEQLTELADFLLRHHFPEQSQHEHPYQALFAEIVRLTAIMIAKWQAYGFTHGVMNTDNMSVHGITFDYGPYGFIDDYEPNFVPNHTDSEGRYALSRQPGIGFWNLQRLAQAMSPLLTTEQSNEALSQYEMILLHHYGDLMRRRFGFFGVREDDGELMGELMLQVEKEHQDYHQVLRQLGDMPTDTDHPPLADMFVDRQRFLDWWQLYKKRTDNVTDQQRQQAMHRVNPKYVLRNYLAEQVIQAAYQGDYQPLHELHQVLLQPFAEQPEFAHYAARPPEWGRHLELSCSS